MYSISKIKNIRDKCMKISTILLNRNGISNRNIENKTVLDKTGYKKPITQPDCFVSFHGKTEEKRTTVKMEKGTISLFNDIKKIYDGQYKETNQKIIENVTKGIALQNLINLKFNKFFNLSMTDNDPENPIEFMKTPENDNNYQLTYKDEKNNTQKIILTNDTIQIEPTSVLNSQNLNKIVFYKLNKLKSALNNEEMCEKTANIIKSRLELKNTLHEKARSFMEAYVDVNNPWEFPSQFCYRSYMRWQPSSCEDGKIIRELKNRKHYNGKDMHEIHYSDSRIYKIDNLDQRGRMISYYNVEQKDYNYYVAEFVNLKEPRYKITYDYNSHDTTTTFNKDGLEFSVTSGYFGTISTKIKDIGEVTTGNNWIEIKKGDTVEHFEFSGKNEKSQKLTEYSVTDKDGVVRKYNLLNFEILESVRNGDVEVFYNKDGSKTKEIEYYSDSNDPKTTKIFGADKSVEKKLFYKAHRKDVVKTVIYNGGIKEKEVGTYYTSHYRTDGTLQSKIINKYYHPEIFKYSSNKNFRQIENHPSEMTYTENYAEDGKTLVSYTFNGETVTLEQLNKDKDKFLKKQALAEKKAKEAEEAKKAKEAEEAEEATSGTCQTISHWWMKKQK